MWAYHLVRPGVLEAIEVKEPNFGCGYHPRSAPRVGGCGHSSATHRWLDDAILTHRFGRDSVHDAYSTAARTDGHRAAEGEHLFRVSVVERRVDRRARCDPYAAYP